MKILPLTLKKKWFDMILSGEKTEEYREIKDYWARRMLVADDSDGIEWWAWEEMVNDLQSPFNRHSHVTELLGFFDVDFKEFDVIRFKNGYSRNAPELLVECKGIDVKPGNESWGAEPGKFYFCLRLGRILSGAA